MSLVDLWLTSHEVRRPFPLSGRRRMQLRTVAGVVELQVLHGQDPGDQHWGCPVRERWGLTSHQQLSPALEDKLAFTVTATASYEEAAAVAGKWGVPVDDSTLHALTQRLGARAEARVQEALKSPPAEREPQRAPTPLAVLMLDGWQGDPVEFGRRLHWQAQRHGLARARATLVAGDGAPWIWNVAQDRWSGATQLLDLSCQPAPVGTGPGVARWR